MVSDFEENGGGIPSEEEQNSDWGRFSKRLVEGIVPDVMRKTAAGAANKGYNDLGLAREK